jgi:RNA polymerase sigma-70 factor (ECF subfamily)
MAKPIHFIPTQWTLVINSADNDTQVRKEALGELYNRYRPPLIGYIERHWPSLRPDAHDLFHDFMLKMIDRNYLGQASRDKGKFRSFLLTLVSRFLHDEWKRRQAERRRPDFDHEPLENLSTPASEPRVEDENFDYEWAIHVIKMVQLQLRDHYQGCDKIKTFDLLRPYLTTEAKADDLEQAATVQGTSSSALRRNCIV